MPTGDFQASLWKVHWLERTLMGRAQAFGRTNIPLLLLALTSSMESLLQAKPNQTLGLEDSCPRTLTGKGTKNDDVYARNTESFVTVASMQEKKEVQMIGNGSKESKKKDAKERFC